MTGAFILPENDEDLCDTLAAFYNDETSTGNAVGEYINDTIKRAAGLLIEVIDDPGVVPNTPRFAKDYDLVNAFAGTPLPQEVCACLSFVDEVYTTTPNPGRHRGRVYIGPLISAAGTDSGTNLPNRPLLQFRETITAAATRLQEDWNSTHGLLWGIWSRADNNTRAVVGGWVDDEWDTQRRRGWERTARTFWP